MSSQFVSLICREVEFDLRNCSGRVETLWTCSGTLGRLLASEKGELGTEARTVEDGVATIQAHLVLKLLLTMCVVGISRVSDPTIGLHESSWAKVLVLVPPVRWTGGRTACTEDALI